MTQQHVQSIRKPISLDEGKKTFGEEFISPNAVSLYIYELSDITGHIECLADGTFLCVVSNSYMHDCDITKVEQFLLDNWLIDNSTDY